MAEKAAKKPKAPDLMERVRKAIDSSNYDFVAHSLERLDKRQVTITEVIYVLKNGRHEAKKDQYDDQNSKWKYAVRGRTVDKRELRLIVVFVDLDMLIITVIDLEPSKMMY